MSPQTTQTADLIPPIHTSKVATMPAQQGFIRDIIIGRQTDRCTREPSIRCRLLIDLPDPHSSKVILLTSESLKNFISVFGDQLSKWFGQEVSIKCHPSDAHGNVLQILPVIR